MCIDKSVNVAASAIQASQDNRTHKDPARAEARTVERHATAAARDHLEICV
jgi:hypothetical protein